MRGVLLALVLAACGDGSAARVGDASAADVAATTAAPDTTVAPDTAPEATPTDVTNAPDSAQDIADVTNAVDATVTDIVVEVDAGPPVEQCPTTDMQTQYPPPFPPFPYGDWTPVDGCVGRPHDVVIVLGCPSEGDGSASSCQTKRAEMADQLFEAGWATHFITTGGAVHNQWNESEALKALLIGRGIPADAIIEEPLAQHTDENIYYSTRIMQAHDWRSAIVVSEDPGHLMFTGLCDADCCVALGRMTLWAFPVDDTNVVKAGHYALDQITTPAECTHLSGIALCTNQDQRKACKDDFQLEAP